MFGIINVFKPRGITSRDCVDHLQKLFYPLKVGHAGTLDPIAEGVLLIAIGQAVRTMDILHELPKKYHGSFWLGRRSESVDTETEMEVLPNAPIPTQSELESASRNFVGQIQQKPPVYSAIKIDGARAYALARKGRKIEIPSREVTVHELTVSDCTADRFSILVHCDGGTYIRSLGRDIAQMCNTDAVMTHLIRTAVGSCNIENAIRLEELVTRSDAEKVLLNPALLMPRNRVVLSDQEVKLMRNGVYLTIYKERIVANSGNRQTAQDEMIAVDLEGRLRSIMTRRSDLEWGGSKNFDPC